MPEALLKRIEELGKELEESELRYQELFEALQQSVSAIARLTDKGEFQVVNEAFANIFGYQSSEMVGRYWHEFIYPEDIERLRSSSNVVEGKIIVEARGLKSTGTLFWLEASWVRIVSHNIFSGYYCFLKDITSRKDSEEKLRKSELELKDFFDNAPVACRWVGPDGRIIRVNRSELQLMQYSEEEYLSINIEDIYVCREDYTFMRDTLINKTPVYNKEVRLRKKGGDIITAVVSSNVLISNGEISHTRTFTRDITQRKNYEVALEEAKKNLEKKYIEQTKELVTSESRFRSIANTTRECFVIFDKDYKILYLNKAVQWIFGYLPEELLLKNLSILTSNPSSFLQESRNTIKLEKSMFVHGKTKDNKQVPLEINFGIHREDGNVLYTATIRDLSSLSILIDIASLEAKDGLKS